MTTLADAPGALVARTVRLEVDGSLLDLLPGDGSLAWLRRGDGLVGWGEVARVEVRGADRFAEADAAWSALVSRAVVRDEVALPGTGPVAFASFAFADDGPTSSVLVVPQVVVGRRGGVAWVTTVGLGRHLPALARLGRTPPPEPPGLVTYADGRMSPARYESVVARAIDRISEGALDKVVLARDLEARTRAPLDVRWLLARLAERYGTCWTFHVDGLVGATPEMLVRRDRGLVTSRVLAGTIRRTGDDDRDLALAASLARSSKDAEEHEYAVRSVLEALSSHCSSTNAPESPFVLHLPNVMHLATDVTGRASDDSSVLALAAALHPSAAVCGTPTDTARQLITELEHMDRGRYAGPVGWVDARGDGELGIALRCAALDPDDVGDVRRLRLMSGCGVVAGSDPAAELAESDAKLVPIRDALAAG